MVTQEEMKPVKNNNLQESPISPILVSFYLADLLDIFETPTNPIEILEMLQLKDLRVGQWEELCIGLTQENSIENSI